MDFVKSLNADTQRDLSKHIDQFHSFASKLNLAELLREELQKWRFNYSVEPTLSGLQSLTLFDGSWFGVNLSVLNADGFPEELLTHVTDGLVYFIRPAEFRFYELSNYTNTKFNPEARASLVREGSVHPGDVFSVTASKQILALNAEQPLLAITLYSKIAQTHCWRFSAESLKALSYVDNYAVNTTLGLMARLLGAYGDVESIECLEELLDSVSDTVRWRSAQAILSIDPVAGKRALEKLSASENDILSSAAKTSLKLLNREMA